MHADAPAFAILLIGRVERLTGLLLSERLAAFDLTYPEFRIVGVLLGEPQGITQKALASKLGLDPSSVSVAIARLEKKGVVVRVRDQADLRNMRVRCAAQIPRFGEVMAAVSELEEQAMRGLAPEERTLLAGLLRRVAANLDAYRVQSHHAQS